MTLTTTPPGDRSADSFTPIEMPPARLATAWRERLYGRVLDLDAALDRLRKESPAAFGPEWVQSKRRLRNAVDVLSHRPTLSGAWTGADIERVWAYVHAVDVDLLRLSDPSTVAARLPGILAEAGLVLGPNDPLVATLAARAKVGPLDPIAVASIADAKSEVDSVTANRHVRVRSFRNILLATTLALTLLATLLGLLGFHSPTAVSLCAAPSVPATPAAPTTCPTAGVAPSRADLVVVELLGVLGAAAVGSVAIRNMRGTSTPYAVPVASLLLKVPTGAITAVGALLLLRAGILGPAVAASGTAQVLAYALAFGASQQTFTRLIDQQTQTVLNSIPSRPDPEGPPAHPAATIPSEPPTTPAPTPRSTAMHVAAPLGTRLAGEAEQVLANNRHTHYQHTIHIDETTGTYDLECSGFVTYLLDNVAPRHLAAISKRPNETRLHAAAYAAFLADLATTAVSGWHAVGPYPDIARGDLIAWALDPPNRDTGHIFVVADPPVQVDESTIAITGLDASDIAHYADSRVSAATGYRSGAGTGTFHLRVDTTGTPTGFQFGQGANAPQSRRSSQRPTRTPSHVGDCDGRPATADFLLEPPVSLRRNSSSQLLTPSPFGEDFSLCTEWPGLAATIRVDRGVHEVGAESRP